MKEIDEKSLVVKKETIFNKFISFFKRIFQKSEYISEDYNVENKASINVTQNISSKNLQIDNTFVKLKNIQAELSKRGINEKNLKILIKDLSEEEKEQLKNLYINQNENLKNEIEMYKRKILAIKTEL